MATSEEKTGISEEKMEIQPLPPEKWLPEILVLGPGGVKGFVLLGALHKLIKAGLLKNVKRYIGVSVGAIINLLLICGYTVDEIISKGVVIDLFDQMNVTIKNIKKNAGLMSNDAFKSYLRQIIIDKMGNIPTLQELYVRTGLILEIVTVNLLSSDEVEYISKDNKPDLLCLDVVMFSMNIPGMFYLIDANDGLYIDGDLGNPYPVDIHDDGKTKILGVSIESKLEIRDSEMKINPFAVMSFVLHSCGRQIKKRIIKGSSSAVKHLILKTIICNTTGLSLNSEDKAKMITEGNDQSSEFLKII